MQVAGQIAKGGDKKKEKRLTCEGREKGIWFD